MAHGAAMSIRGGQYAALRSQIIRAAMSVPTNIVEGRAQRTDREFARFLRHAAASGAELEYHLTVARDLAILPEAVSTTLLSLTHEVQRMLHGLVTKLEGPRVPRL
jgi:four helix bundle protein